MMNLFIIGHFLGPDWPREHANLNSSQNSFLFPEFDDDDRAPFYSVRMLLFAEMLFNLQWVAGFGQCLDHLSEDQLESGYAELQIGMVLKQHNVNFRYRDPHEAVGRVADIEIKLPSGETGIGELKCKLDRTPYSDKTLRNTLNDARKQIPPDRSGVIFVKIPQDWVNSHHSDPAQMADLVLSASIVRVSTEFLRATRRIKRIVYYVLHLKYDRSYGVGATHAVMEFTNKSNSLSSPWNKELLTSSNDADWIALPDLIAKWTRKAAG